MKSLRFVVPLAVFLAIGAFLYAGLGKDTRLVPSPLIDRVAPAFALPSLREPHAKVALADFAGAPFLLNVWGSWCAACRDEHALLMAIAREGRVPIVGLNWKDQPEDATRWLARFGDPYRAIAVDAAGRTAIDYGVYGAPETFLVDAQGVIRYKKIGPLTRADYETEILPRLAGGSK